ncbi:MAG: O-antigen ligase family protein [Gammaproteobacteria bacterium]
MNTEISAHMRSGDAVSTHQFRLTRLAVYVLTLVLCVPSDLFAKVMPGHRQFLLPAAVALLLLVWLVADRGRLRAFTGLMSVLWAALALFLLWVVAASVLHPNVRESMALVGAYLVRMVMLFVLVQILSGDWELLIRTQRLLVVGLGLLGLLMVTGLLDRFGGQVLATDVGGLHINRATAGLGDPNLTALIFNIGVALALGWLVTASSPRRRLLAGCIALLLVVGIGRTVSLGGVFGLVAVLWLTFWWMAPRAGYPLRWTLTLFIGGLMLAIIAVAGGVYLERLQQQAVRTEQSAGNFGSQRLNLALGGMRMAVANPLFGEGPVNVPAAMPVYVPFQSDNSKNGVHDGYISVAAESGLPSWLLIMGAAAISGTLFSRALRRARHSDYRESYLIGGGIAVALVASLVQTAALDTQRQPFLWFVAALALSFAAHWRQPPSRLRTSPSGTP